MTTKQYFEMELPFNVTRCELYKISDAIYIAEQVYKEKGHKATARTLNDLYDKINKKIDMIDKYFE